MKSVIALAVLLICASSFTFREKLEALGVPQTHIGDESVACNPGSEPRVTNGFATWFKDDVYACDHWNHKAKGTNDCYVAINGVCGMKTGTFCDKCVNVINSNGQGQKCRIIDFCDPKNCDFLDPGHLDILNNNNNANYRFVDKGDNVTPYSGAGGQPKIRWHYASC